MKKEYKALFGRSTLVIVAEILLVVLVWAVSATLVKDYTTDAANYQWAIASIDSRKATVTGLSAAAAAAATAVAAIPGDATTPIAEQIMEISSYLLIVVCVLVLEKSLITVMGGLSFGVIIPAACVLFIVWLLRRKDWLYQLAVKLAVFALALAVIIPCSVWASDRIYEVNSESVTQVMEETVAQQDNAQQEDTRPWWERVSSAVSEGTEKLKEEAQRVLNRFVDAIAIFVITYCAIPVLVVLAVLWLLKMFFGVNIPAPKQLPRLPLPKHRAPKQE
ncbi:MAG: hypothetical protein IJC61_06550 [Oscillospiraceae bacterium]|nr:hypothetical protein [Oscillospiraceae bacterium]